MTQTNKWKHGKTNLHKSFGRAGQIRLTHPPVTETLSSRQGGTDRKSCTSSLRSWNLLGRWWDSFYSLGIALLFSNNAWSWKTQIMSLTFIAVKMDVTHVGRQLEFVSFSIINSFIIAFMSAGLINICRLVFIFLNFGSTMDQNRKNNSELSFVFKDDPAQ